MTPKGTRPVTPARTAESSGAARRRGVDGAPLYDDGRRVVRPGLQLLIAVLWIVAGVVTLVRVHAAWRLLPAVAFIGVGVFYLRAAGTTFLRQQR